ncbi:MAG: ParA family protein [Deltaproteobacteria bacterium]|jgi:chromosome partitioning protein
MRIIASANQKGGCGKTTTAINLSYFLAKKGEKVLLIDFDPQAHATMGLNIKPADLEMSMYDVIRPSQNGSVAMDDILIPIRENLDLAPSNASLSAIEQELTRLMGRESRLFQAVEALRRTYDYVIIDCPPSIGHLCFNALRACEEVIIPIDLSLFSLRGVSKLQEIVMILKERLGHDVKSRALITMYDNRTRYSRQVLEEVRSVFRENVFETVIRYNIRLREAGDCGLPVGEYDKHAIGYKDYEDLAEEVMGSKGTRMDHAFDATGAGQNVPSQIVDDKDDTEALPVGEVTASIMEEHPPAMHKSGHDSVVESVGDEATDSVYVAKEDS